MGAEVRYGLMLALIVTGAASRYDPGVMDGVARTRNFEVVDAAEVAMLDCDLVGSWVFMCYQDACRWARVTDCAGIADGGADWMVRGGYAAELDYETAIEWDCVGQEISIYHVIQEGYTYE